jgi:hypothetical protein
MKLFREAHLAFNLHFFQRTGLNAQEIQVHHSKERKFWSRNNIKVLTFTLLYFYKISAFEEYGSWEYIRTSTNLNKPHIYA